MTDGHKHRHVRVKKDGLAVRVLCAPLFTTTNFERIDASPYPYGPTDEEAFRAGERDQPFYLSILSILHRWTGLTLEYDTSEGE